ncbi:MAG TPA: ATP-dependent zinc metalloprotease FtsH [Fibrobacteria bacterium]|nr:ATP-dependent zinc metalloprotease FtsH [Fibrobacteria bacterium]
MADQRDDNREPERDSDKTSFRMPRGSGLLVILILLAFLISQVISPSDPSGGELTYNQFLELMGDSTKKVKSLTVLKSTEGVEVRGQRELDSAERKAAHNRMVFLPKVESKDFSVRVLALEDSTLQAWATQRKIQVKVRERESEWFLPLLMYLLPILLIGGMLYFTMRQGQNGPKGLFSFGKSRARLSGKDVPKVFFDDVAGCDEAKAELVEVVDFLKDPGKYDRLGGKIPRGVLLMGPPGTGKTLLAKAVAGEAKVPFFSMSGSSFVEMFVGVGASRVRDLFEQAKKAAPSLIFIDEIDAVGRQRGTGLGGGHDEREQTLNQLLIEMDGFSGNEGVIIVAATNRPDVLDPALLRPGRFDRRVVVDAPDLKGRLEILKVHTGTKIPLSSDVDLAKIARGTPGFSGADLANLCNEAALLAARLGREAVTMDDFEKSKDKVHMGPERRSRMINAEDRKVVAWHEAGHAVVGWFTPLADPVHKVTIIPRGRALGLTWSLPEDDRSLVTKSYLEAELDILLGGRLAEEVYLGEITTGASNDIQRATELARKMVCEYGMSKLGPQHFGDNQQQVFLGRDFATQRETSEETAKAIDNEVRRLIDEAYGRTRALLVERKREIELLAETLLQHESLESDDIKELFETGTLAKPLPLAGMEKPADEAPKA